MSKIFSGGMLLITMTIYFTLLSFIVASALNLQVEAFENTGTLDDVDGYEYISQFGGECSVPRSYYDAKTLNTYEVSGVRLPRLNCVNSPGVTSPDMCNAIHGCSWDTTSSGWWLWKEEYDTCLGTINATEYGMEMEYVLGNWRVAEHENSVAGKFWHMCNHPEVIYDKETCTEVFACTWLTIDDKINQQLQHTNVVRTFGNLLSFQYDWGFENPVLAGLMNFLLVVVPLLLVIIGIYSLIPFI